MQVIVINGNGGKAEKRDIEFKLDEYYKIIGCEYIDMTQVLVDGTPFDIICDDEALFKDGKKYVTVANHEKDVMICGTVIICRHDYYGYEVPLGDGEVEKVMKRIIPTIQNKNEIQMTLMIDAR